MAMTVPTGPEVGVYVKSALVCAALGEDPRMLPAQISPLANVPSASVFRRVLMYWPTLSPSPCRLGDAVRSQPVKFGWAATAVATGAALVEVFDAATVNDA